MNRLGRIIAGLLVLAAIAVAAMLRWAPASRTPAPAAPPSVEAGGLVIPVQGVSATALVASFGDSRKAGGDHVHGAIDIMAPRGTPVLAAAAGTVEKLFESERGGHTVYQRSADGGTVYYYAHLDAYAAGLREGVYLAQGQQLGSVGATGDASAEGPHLHFEIKRMAPGEHWWEGRGVDPFPLLGGTGGSGGAGGRR